MTIGESHSSCYENKKNRLVNICTSTYSLQVYSNVTRNFSRMKPNSPIILPVFSERRFPVLASWCFTSVCILQSLYGSRLALYDSYRLELRAGLWQGPGAGFRALSWESVMTYEGLCVCGEKERGIFIYFFYPWVR